MRGNFRFISYIALGLICVASRSSAQKQDSCETIKAILADATAIHVGMTRADLEKEFEPSSFTLRSAATYESKKCAYVAVDVEFDTTASPNGSPSADDKITKISRPYLWLPSRD